MDKIAIIGTGVSGMAVGYFLRHKYDITFFDKEHYAGGHTNTLTVDDDGDDIHIDSAFMVFNHVTYPNLLKFFKTLDIEEKDTDMSFSVQHRPTGLEYCGTGLNGLFSQRRNLFRPRHYRTLMDINRFNKEAPEVLEDNAYIDWTVDRYITDRGYSRDMLDHYLVPMSSAVWSTPPEQMLDFPIVTLVRFFKNHGFLGLNTQYQWKTLVGGSRQYRDKVMALFEGKVHLGSPVIAVRRQAGRIEIKTADDRRHAFDKVILAAHADQSLDILADPTPDEKHLLSKFKYQPNTATLHTDSSVMPKTRKAWSAWNYRITQREGRTLPTTIYFMNKLQHVSRKRDYFVSINDPGDIDRGKVIWEKEYHHPLFDVDAIKAQPRLNQLNQNGHTFFCGAYFKYGFHEDGFTAGMNVAQRLLGELKWI
ncbi:MAG: FAD-dependent oxidoreductase [Candidatus Omnitrophica bacterium]|nr:FAD-dependent oxidoreductase [Candidatus Omnitrophota bacterium]MCB9721036.1 FAD-dependent oxidoreductase [Candidatus Omnitrophota bacterium]